MEEYITELIKALPIPLLKTLVFATVFGVLFNPLYKLFLYPCYVLLFRFFISCKYKKLIKQIDKIIKSIVIDTSNCLAIPVIIDKEGNNELKCFGEPFYAKAIVTDIFYKYEIYNEMAKNIFFFKTLLFNELNENFYRIFTVGNEQILVHKFADKEHIRLEFNKSNTIIINPNQ